MSVKADGVPIDGIWLEYGFDRGFSFWEGVMRYSERPHEDYVGKQGGPGACFLGDLEMWNWRYLLEGTEQNNAYDESLKKHFNEHQRDLMVLPPLEAVAILAERFAENGCDRITKDVWVRAESAQARLFPPKVSHKQDNIVFANFRTFRKT